MWGRSRDGIVELHRVRSRHAAGRGIVEVRKGTVALKRGCSARAIAVIPICSVAVIAVTPICALASRPVQLPNRELLASSGWSKRDLTWHVSDRSARTREGPLGSECARTPATLLSAAWRMRTSDLEQLHFEQATQARADSRSSRNSWVRGSLSETTIREAAGPGSPWLALQKRR